MLPRLVRPAAGRAFPPKRRNRMYVADRPVLDNALFCGLCVLLILVMATAFILDNRYRVDPTESRNATRIDIPDVTGMPASDARARLERAGLKFAGAEAAVGTPGQVLRTRPAIGRRVPSDTPVTLVVGVNAERYVLETGGL
jgi:beta-lactam-binding protein with PASTA domain